MNNLYEFYSKRNQYRTLKDNILTAVNVLSNVDVSDNIISISNSLKTNYVVNDIASYSSELEAIASSLNTNIKDLSLCLSSVNSKIYSLDNEIARMESEGAL